MKITVEISNEQATKVAEIASIKQLDLFDVLTAIAYAGVSYGINETLRVERERAGIATDKEVTGE